jgi:beta-galactosidase
VCATVAESALTGPCDLWCEVLHLEGAQAIATFGEDFYSGRPAITEHQFGAGRAYYVATRLDASLLQRLLGTVAAVAGVQAPLAAPAGVEVVQRVGAAQVYTFVLNHHAQPQVVPLALPMRNLLTDTVHQGELLLPGRGVAVLVPEAE